MARRLGIRVEQLDILEGVYHPRGFWQIEQEQQALRRLLLEIAGPTGYHGRACAARDGRAAARRQYLAMVPRSIGTPNNEKPRP
jgi:hypothetical protein